MSYLGEQGGNGSSPKKKSAKHGLLLAIHSALKEDDGYDTADDTSRGHNDGGYDDDKWRL